MLEPAVIILRLIQYIGAMVLLGTAMFFVYGLPAQGPASAQARPWAKPLLLVAALVLTIAAVLGLLIQTMILAGSVPDGLKLEALAAVVTGMALGKAAVVRSLAATVAVIALLVLGAGRRCWFVCALLGVVCVGSFAWMGHAAASEGVPGLVHLAADMVHGYAAALWVGALIAFALLLGDRSPAQQAVGALHDALARFSRLGSLIVAATVMSGLVNSWFLVGPTRLEGLWTTLYGRLLLVKLALFVGMLGLAAANRFRLAPALGCAADQAGALKALRVTVGLELAAGITVLAAVAWLGTLAPPASL